MNWQHMNDLLQREMASGIVGTSLVRLVLAAVVQGEVVAGDAVAESGGEARVTDLARPFSICVNSPQVGVVHRILPSRKVALPPPQFEVRPALLRILVWTAGKFHVSSVLRPPLPGFNGFSPADAETQAIADTFRRLRAVPH